MKKLIAMIGAVATAFGLYATDLVERGISFEANDPGSSGNTLNIAAPDARASNAILWATDAEDFDAPKIKEYADETAPIAPYAGYTTGKARRDSMFNDTTTQAKYLSLSTGTNSLIRTFAHNAGEPAAVQVDEGLFVDTLVRLTGFEEKPEFEAEDGTKVSVWLEAVESDDEANPPVEGYTNLWIACASLDAQDAATVQKFVIAGNYVPEQWYRLTIKSIGNIFKDDADALNEARLGFLVWIDGNQIACDDAKALVYNTAAMKERAADYMAQGILFPAITKGLGLKGAGFQGMGQIDDLIVSKADANGTPDFAKMIDFTVSADNAEAILVLDKDGNEVKKLDGKYSVKPGDDEYTVTFRAVGAYVLTKTEVTTKVNADTLDANNDIDLSDEVDAQEAVAAIDETYFASMADALEAVQYAFTVEAVDEVTVEVLAEGADYVFTLDDEYTYTFAKGTITVTKGSGADVSGNWDIYISEENEEQAMSEDFGAMPEKQIHITFDDSEAGVFNLAGNIYGNGRVDTLVWVEGTTKLMDALVIGATFLAADGAGATLKTDALDLDGNQITLDGKGKVMVKTELTLADAFTNDADDIAVTEPAEDGDYYTYALKQGAAFTINAIEHATITCEGATWDATLEKWVAPKAGDDVEVTVTADEGYLFADGSDKKTETIQAVDGATVELKTPAPDAAKAKKGGMLFITLQDAVNSTVTGDIELLDNVTLTETLAIAKTTTINLAGNTVTFGAELETGIDARDVTGGIVIKNGKIVSAAGRTNIAGSKAIYLLRTSAVFTDVEIDAPGFDYVLTHMGNIADGSATDNRNEYWTILAPYNLDCNNVDIKGNGSLFHLEYVQAVLDPNCSAEQYTDKGYFSEAHQAAIYSSCGAIVTVKGGYYTAVNALQTGNLGGDIVIKNGEFTGNIKSFMLDADTRYKDNDAYIQIDGGKFTGNFVYAANCSAESERLTVAISGGDFSDTTIPTAFIKTTDTQIGKWVASTIPDYVTPATVEAVAKVGDVLCETAEAALAAVQAAEKAGTLPITVTALADKLTVTIGEEPNQQSVTLAKGENIVVMTDSWVFTAPFAGHVVLAPGKMIRAMGGQALGATITTIDGYKVVASDPDTLGYITYSVEACSYVAQIEGGAKYETLAEALTAAQAGDTVTLLANIELTDTLTIGKAITLDLGTKKITLAPTATVGIEVTAAATVKNGGITGLRETYGEAYAIVNMAVNATYKDLDIVAKNYKFALACDSNHTTDPASLASAYTTAPTVTVNCENVGIMGNGTFFYAQHTLLNLDEDCSATALTGTDMPAGGYAAAVYSALNATITIAGGNYSHDYSLISGNLGGKIVVNGGGFIGDIKSYMKVGAHTELEQYDDYVASFVFNAGSYDDGIVFEDESAEARELDSFWKASAVTLAAPEGYEWDEDGYLVAVQAQPFGGGTGTEADPYIIATYDHLVELQTKVAAGDTFAGKYFKQDVNIDFTGKDPWTGIGSHRNASKKNFAGIYDGNGKRIDNVTFARMKYGAFFLTLDGEIRNLTIEVDGIDLEGATTGEEYGAAAFAGYMMQGSKIIGCTAEGTLGTAAAPITHKGSGITDYVMGAVDQHNAPVIEGCTNKMNIAVYNECASGFIAYGTREDSSSGVANYVFITDCVNEGTIIGVGSGSNAGSIIAGVSYFCVTIDGCIDNGSCSGEGAYGSLVSTQFKSDHDYEDVITAVDCVVPVNCPIVGNPVAGSGKSPIYGCTYGVAVAGKDGYAKTVSTLVKDTEYTMFADDDSTTIFTLAAKDNYIAFKKGVDTVTLPTAEQITVADDETLEVKVDETYTAGVKFVAIEKVTDITVTVKKGTGIASVTVDEKALEFDANNEATFKVKPDVLTATLTLAAESTIKIPAYTMSIGEGSEGWTVTNKTPVVTADAENLAKNYFTFAAEEASTTDPAITDDAAATAIKEAAPAVAEKVDALTTGDGAIRGKALVNWIATKGGNDAATALAGNYVKASVALDVAPITESTVVKVDTVEKATSDLAVTIKVGDVDATVDQIKSFVELCDDLGATGEWQKLPQSELKQAVKIEEGKLVITPVAGIDKLFLKVVIPADAK